MQKRAADAVWFGASELCAWKGGEISAAKTGAMRGLKLVRENSGA